MPPFTERMLMLHKNLKGISDTFRQAKENCLIEAFSFLDGAKLGRKGKSGKFTYPQNTLKITPDYYKPYPHADVRPLKHT